MRRSAPVRRWPVRRSSPLRRSTGTGTSSLRRVAIMRRPEPRLRSPLFRLGRSSAAESCAVGYAPVGSLKRNRGISGAMGASWPAVAIVVVQLEMDPNQTAGSDAGTLRPCHGRCGNGASGCPLLNEAAPRRIRARLAVPRGAPHPGPGPTRSGVSSRQGGHRGRYPVLPFPHVDSETEPAWPARHSTSFRTRVLAEPGLQPTDKPSGPRPFGPCPEGPARQIHAS